MRDLVNQLKTSTDPNYCVRVTANDGQIGEQFLRTFQDNEKTIPTILTTSQKLSTGVDARNVRNIVLMRPINSMIEFKQIIGRGTRLPHLIELRYHGVADAVAELGRVPEIRELFIGFQRHLYARSKDVGDKRSPR